MQEELEEIQESIADIKTCIARVETARENLASIAKLLSRPGRANKPEVVEQIEQLESEITTTIRGDLIIALYDLQQDEAFLKIEAGQ